jgi:type IV secretion system protein VirB9
MRRTLLAGAAVAAALLTSSAHAEQTPRSGGYDPRVQVVSYNPMNVVRLVGSPTNSTQIIFAAGEVITQVAIGDADAWLAQPAGNLLFIKPTEIRLSTNMQVVTRRPDGSNRSYQFRLIAQRRGEDGASPAVYAVNFTYPADEAAARAAARASLEAAEAERSAQALLASAWAEGPRNWRYVAQGSRLIEPIEVSDNGRQTAFRFPGNMRVPTIYTVAPDGAETIVPYTAVNDMTVVQTTAREFILRDGQEVLRVINQGFDPVGRNPGTGTGTPDMTRFVRGPGL